VKFLPDGTYNQKTYLSKSDKVFQPHGLTVYNDLLFVCDPKSCCIRILNLDLQSEWKFKVEFQHLKTTFMPKYIVYGSRDNTYLQGDMQEILNVHIDTVMCTGQGY